MLVLKILRPAELADLVLAGETLGAPVDRADGFIHFSAPSQVAETAARHFGGEPDLWLLACEQGALGNALRWEPSRGGALFPHLHRPLRRADILWIRPLPLRGSAHRFPELG